MLDGLHIERSKTLPTKKPKQKYKNENCKRYRQKPSFNES